MDIPLSPQEKWQLAEQRLPELYDLLDPCRLCPRQCMAKRRSGETGECGIGDELIISSIGLHHGEEFPVSGYYGSGTVFLAGCNLHCLFCQNWSISQARQGEPMTTTELAQSMLKLEAAGAHNINWVSPTHVVPMLIEALVIALREGLKIPIVYNSGGYDSPDVLEKLEGLIDIYMPDMKYGDDSSAEKLSDIKNYVQHNQTAIRKMYRQVGPLQCSSRGVARRGLLIRHLVLPENLAATGSILDFLETELPGTVDINIMEQYYPCYRAQEIPALSRRLSHSEYLDAVKMAGNRESLRMIE